MMTPYVTRFPRSLDPSPFPATVRFRETIPLSSEPLPSWWGDLEGPLVYMTFGTVLGHMANAVDVYRMALDAVKGLDARILMTTGRKFDAYTLGPVPQRVHVEAWVDQHRVLGHADLVVTHCGSGTALGALAAGAPSWPCPSLPTSLRTAPIAAAGAAFIVEGRQDQDVRTRALVSEHDVRNLASAIERVLGDPAYTRNAGSIAAEMAAAPTVDETLGRLPNAS